MMGEPWLGRVRFPSWRGLPARQRLARSAIALSAVVALGFLYVLFASSGRVTEWNHQTSYYDLLAEGFRAGHLHLSDEPKPELLAKADPTNEAHRDLWIWDVSLYKSHYYLYWGPVPGLILAGVKSILRIHKEVGDEYLVPPFVFGRFLFGAAFIASAAQLFGARRWSWSTITAIAVFGLANPVPYFLARGAVYEVAIAAGQFFLVAGLYFALRGVMAPVRKAAAGWLVAAGVSWAMILGSRISLIVCIGPLILLTLFARLFSEASGGDRGSFWRRALKLLAAVSIPILVGGLAIGWYNYARFDSFTETGVGLQLTTMKYRWDKAYILPNTYAYLFRNIKATCDFPFVYVPAFDWNNVFPRTWKLPADYYPGEPAAGFLTSAPWNWLVVIVFLMPIVRLARRRKLRALLGPSDWPALFCILGAIVLATAPGVGILGMWMPSMRYGVDMAAGLSLLATFGWWSWMHASPIRFSRRIGAMVGALLAVASIGIGVLMGTDGYYHQLQRNNIPLYSRLSRLKVCGPGAPAHPWLPFSSKP